MTYPSVSVIIPNYNGRKFIVNCLKSVLATDYPNLLEIIVVDDGSTDGSVDIVRREFKNEERVRVIRCSVNKGAAKAKNIGAEKAIGDVLCFLDNDTEVEKDWLTELIKVLLSEVNVGAAQSLLLDYKKRHIIQVAGVKLVPYIGLAVPLLQGKRIYEINEWPTEICGLSAALAVKRHVFFKVGEFDERLVAYTEDLDFSWRVWLSGYKILLAPHSRVYHWTKPPEMRKDAGFSSYSFNFHLTKNSLRSVLKNSNLLKLSIQFPLTLFFHSARFLLMTGKRDYAASLGIIRGFQWNFINLRDTLVSRNKNRRISTKAKIPSFYGFHYKGLSLCR